MSKELFGKLFNAYVGITLKMVVPLYGAMEKTARVVKEGAAMVEEGARLQARALKEREGDVGERRAAVEEHEALCRHLLNRDGATLREAVAACTDQHEFVLKDALRDELGVRELVDQRDLDLVADHHVEDLVGVAAAHRNLDQRIGGFELTQ